MKSIVLTIYNGLIFCGDYFKNLSVVNIMDHMNVLAQIMQILYDMQ